MFEQTLLLEGLFFNGDGSNMHKKKLLRESLFCKKVKKYIKNKLKTRKTKLATDNKG